MTTNQKQHIAVAKTLRFAGYEAKVHNNNNEAQPVEIHVSNIDNDILNNITSMMSKLYMNSTLNIIAI